MNLSNQQWQKLRGLRKYFLSGEPNHHAYWDSDETVALYDQTFAVRIGWRWDAVIDQLRFLNWQPSGKILLDWGCGAGIATRKILTAFSQFETAYLADLSPIAERYAVELASPIFPATSIRTGIPSDEPFCLILSHVLGELDDTAEQQLAQIMARASSLIWVEPGTYAVSRRLVTWRDRLGWPVVAPCTHHQPCPMRAQENRHHWCHFFAQPPPEIFMSADWSEFAKQMEIDLGTLAFSYLVLDRLASLGYNPEIARSIGSTRVYKASAKLQLCDAGGLHDVELMKRDFPDTWKALKKGWSPDLLKVEMNGNRISKLAETGKNSRKRSQRTQKDPFP
jgi:hypothetical protein